MRANIRSALLSVAGVAGSAGGWLIGFKAIALWLGPEGVGLFAQLRQYVQIATLSATFGGTNVIVQGLATCSDATGRRLFRSSATHLFALAGLVVVAGGLIGASRISGWLFANETAGGVELVRWMTLAVGINVIATYQLGLLNGYRSLGYLATAQMSGPLVMAIIVIASANMSLLAPNTTLICAFLACFMTTATVAKLGSKTLDAAVPSGPSQANNLDRGLLRFAISALVGALLSTATLMLVRIWLVDSKGLSFLGLFEAAWTLTFNYITLLLTACSTIYLPRLSATSDPIAQRNLVLKATYWVFGTSTLICYALALWPQSLIHLFYSSKFDEAAPMLAIMAAAVLLRSISWTYGTIILATRKSAVLLLSDLAINAALLVAVQYALNVVGTLDSIAWAFFVAHALYLCFVIEYARLQNVLLQRRRIWPILLAGVLPLIALSI